MQNEAHKKPATAEFYLKFGLAVILTVFGGLALWSVVAPIDGAVTAPGQIVVEGNRKAVQHLEGGVVSDIMVREGTTVQQGDIILRLDDTLARTNLALVDAQLAELYARRVRLIAERDDKEVLGPPTGLAPVLEMPAFAEKLAGQTNLFFARATTGKTQVSQLKENIVQQNERISGLRVQIRALDSQLVIIGEELQGVRELLAEGLSLIHI